VFIVTESIFSMDGDVADLPGLVAVAREYDAILYVDEAHGIGVRGQAGLGLCEEMGVLGSVDIVVGTFGKALASQGAFAVVHPTLRAYLVNAMRSFIFTTGLPPVIVNWNLQAFCRMLGAGARRKHVCALAEQFRTALGDAGVETKGASQIVPAIVGSNEAAVAAAHRLREAGVLALPVRPPTVPAGSARLRFSLTADMCWEDLAPVVNILGRQVAG
jgi:8-amino-7-oxononanoate synthase